MYALSFAYVAARRTAINTLIARERQNTTKEIAGYEREIDSRRALEGELLPEPTSTSTVPATQTMTLTTATLTATSTAVPGKYQFEPDYLLFLNVSIQQLATASGTDEEDRRTISTAASKLQRYFLNDLHWAVGHLLRHPPSRNTASFHEHFTALITVLRNFHAEVSHKWTPQAGGCSDGASRLHR